MAGKKWKPLSLKLSAENCLRYTWYKESPSWLNNADSLLIKLKIAAVSLPAIKATITRSNCVSGKSSIWLKEEIKDVFKNWTLSTTLPFKLSKFKL